MTEIHIPLEVLKIESRASPTGTRWLATSASDSAKAARSTCTISATPRDEAAAGRCANRRKPRVQRRWTPQAKSS